MLYIKSDLNVEVKTRTEEIQEIVQNLEYELPKLYNTV